MRTSTILAKGLQNCKSQSNKVEIHLHIDYAEGNARKWTKQEIEKVHTLSESDRAVNSLIKILSGNANGQ